VPKDPASEVIEVEVTENIIVRYCILNDVKKLWRWAQQGVRVESAHPSCTAALFGRLNVMRRLVKDIGADVSQADKDGHHPLYVAAQVGHLPAVRCLVKDLDADVNQQTDDGLTPMSTAACMGRVDLLYYLVKELDANVNLGDTIGCTPMYAAAEQGRVDVVLCLGWSSVQTSI
jgi:ankyrin repeat protein